MTDNKHSSQRNQLHANIWAIANQLRGSVDSWEFKQYILGMLFYRFLSENVANYYTNMIRKFPGYEDFSYENLDDEVAEEKFRKLAIEEKGVFIKPSQLFCNVVKNGPKNENLNETLSQTFLDIENSTNTESAKDLKGLFSNFNVSDSKLGLNKQQRNAKLLKILEAISALDFGNVEDHEIDAFGDAYEFLISNYAKNAGKSGGEFFTPQTVSKLLARIASFGIEKPRSVYDPTCGSGSLLLQFRKLFSNSEVRFYGQEINETNYNMARMNMFLHNVNYSDFSIAFGDTLLNPAKHLRTEQKDEFTCIVSNPPYSLNWIGSGDPTLIDDERYSPAGVLAPKSAADLAFVMHCLSHLSDDGRAAILCYPGALYRSGAEAKIRKYLVEGNFVEAIIHLPRNLFYGTNIATSIMVLSKHKKDEKILFVNAENLFEKEPNSTNNHLSDKNIEDIMSLFSNKEDKEYLSSYVDNNNVAEQGCSLQVSKYVSVMNPEELSLEDINREIEENFKTLEELKFKLAKY